MTDEMDFTAAPQPEEETPAGGEIPAEPDLPAEDAAPQGPDYLRMTLTAGVAPLEMRFAQINSAYRRLPVAYRSFTYVNSVMEGVVPPEKYAYAADGTDRGERLAKWNIRQAVRAAQKMTEAGRHVQFITARCPASLAAKPDLYDWMKALLAELHCDAPDKLCLEFPRTLLFEDTDAVRAGILSMKLLKVRTLMSGCGEQDSPVTPLVHVPVDMVLLAPWLSVLADSRSKGPVVSALLAFLRALPCDVIGDGLANDDQIAAFSRADCLGYIPSAGYEGTVQHGRLRMTLDEATAQQEEEEI